MPSGPLSLSVSLFFPDYLFRKIIELTRDPCYPHDGTLRERIIFTFDDWSNFQIFHLLLWSTIFVKAYFRFSRLAGGVFECAHFVINQLDLFGYIYTCFAFNKFGKRNYLVSSTRHPLGSNVSIHSQSML